MLPVKYNYHTCIRKKKNSAPSSPYLAAFDKTAGCDKDINIGINNSK